MPEVRLKAFVVNWGKPLLTIITCGVMLIMPAVEYYTRNSGRQPVAEWLDGLDDKSKANIVAKIDKLARLGLELLRTEMLNVCSGLRGISTSCVVANAGLPTTMTGNETPLFCYMDSLRKSDSKKER